MIVKLFSVDLDVQNSSPLLTLSAFSHTGGVGDGDKLASTRMGTPSRIDFKFCGGLHGCMRTVHGWIL